MQYIELITPVIAGGLRNIAGYLENCFKTGTEKFSWGQFGGTILEVFIISVAAIFGLHTDAATSSGIGVLGSFLFSAIKKSGVVDTPATA